MMPTYPSLKPRTIALVEDSQDDYEAFERMLRRVAPETPMLRFETGRELLEAALPERPLVVLLDLNLPEESGLRVLRRLRTHPDWRTVPVVVFSGSDWHEDVAAAYTGGAAGYLVKPFEPEGLREQIETMMQWWSDTVEVPPARPVLDR
jgi:DNA-binding response OmpR family regulator